MAFKSSVAPGSPKITIFLGEGSEVQLPNCILNTGAAGAEIRFGTVSESVQFVRKPSPSEDNLTIPRLPSRGRRPNIIVPTTNEDVAVDEPPRTSVFQRLSRPKRIVSKNDDDDEPAFTITAKGHESGIFQSDNDTHKKSVFSRLTPRKMKVPKRKLDFVSFQEHRGNQMGSFNNSFDPLKMVKKNATTAELRPQLKGDKGGRPPKSHHKNSFNQNLYKTYAASKKLQSDKMTPREFYKKKKQLESRVRRTVFDRITSSRNEAATSRSKFHRRRKAEDEETSDMDVEKKHVH